MLAGVPGRADLGQDICMAWAVKRPAEGRRQVWMADDLTAYCRAFHAQACRLQPERTVFFSDSHGNAYTKVWLDKTFRTVRAQAGITPAGGTLDRVT